jgi:ubiquitin C-terminal hydrolase
VETFGIPLDGILEELDLSSYTRNNQPANYKLIGFLSHIENSRGEHVIAYIKDGTNWIKFDNPKKQQIPSLQDIEGKGVAFLYRRL